MVTRVLNIVQSQVVSLGRLPFLNKKELRSQFVPMFASTCYSSMREYMIDPWGGLDDEDESSLAPSLPSKPFIKNLGPLYFDVNSVRLAQMKGRSWPKFQPGGYDGHSLVEALHNETLHRKMKADPEMASFNDPHCFGYNPRLEDQRMNMLYFQLRHPMFMKGILDDRVLSDGRVHLHFFPCGYLVINLYFSLKNESLKSLEAIKLAMLETRPWSHGNSWQWQSRFGTTSLPDLLTRIKELVFRSMYKSDIHVSASEGDWHFIVKAVAGWLDTDKFVSALLPQGYSSLPLGQRPVRGEVSVEEVLSSTNKGMVCCISPYRSKKSAMRYFRKIFSIYEFVLLKNQIYADYASFLRPEIAELRKYRLSVKHKILEDDIRKMSVYNNQIPAYLLQLDAHIRSISANYRRIYSFISKSLRFDQHRSQVYKYVKEWEEEVGQWEPTLGLLWKKIVAPLRSFLS